MKLEAAFGGINVTYNNPTESNIVINIDVMNEKNEYVSLEKIYTKAKMVSARFVAWQRKIQS